MDILRILRLIAGAMMLAVPLSCASGEAPPVEPNGVLLIVNASQFTFLELRFHQTPDYLSADNVLEGTEGMVPEAEALFYGDADWYVTYYRRKSQLEDVLAFTTATPIQMKSLRGQKLTIFDQSFRVEMGDYVDPKTTDFPIYGVPFPAQTSTTSASRRAQRTQIRTLGAVLPPS